MDLDHSQVTVRVTKRGTHGWTDVCQTFGFLVRFLHVQGLEMLVQTASPVRARESQARLVLVGDSSADARTGLFVREPERKTSPHLSSGNMPMSALPRPH
jgi:hypothetical protein